MNRKTLKRIVQSPSVGDVVPLVSEIRKLDRDRRRLRSAIIDAESMLKNTVYLGDTYSAMHAMLILADALEPEQRH